MDPNDFRSGAASYFPTVSFVWLVAVPQHHQHCRPGPFQILPYAKGLELGSLYVPPL
jgi:hypothetical protein